MGEDGIGDDTGDCVFDSVFYSRRHFEVVSKFSRLVPAEIDEGADLSINCGGRRLKCHTDAHTGGGHFNGDTGLSWGNGEMITDENGSIFIANFDRDTSSKGDRESLVS